MKIRELKEIRTNKKLIPMLIAIIFAAIMLLCVFLPYASANEEQAQLYKEFSEQYRLEKANMDGKDLINVSMIEFAKMYATMGKEMFRDAAQGMFYAGLVALIALFSLITLICAIKKKTKSTIIFGILAFLVFFLQCFDYKDRGVVPSLTYDWGIGYYMFIVSTLGLIISLKIYSVLKKKEEKAKINN